MPERQSTYMRIVTATEKAVAAMTAHGVDHLLPKAEADELKAALEAIEEERGNRITVTLISRATTALSSPVQLESSVVTTRQIFEEAQEGKPARQLLINTLRASRLDRVRDADVDESQFTWDEEWWIGDLHDQQAFIKNREPKKLDW